MMIFWFHQLPTDPLLDSSKWFQLSTRTEQACLPNLSISPLLSSSSLLRNLSLRCWPVVQTLIHKEFRGWFEQKYSLDHLKLLNLILGLHPSTNFLRGFPFQLYLIRNIKLIYQCFVILARCFIYPLKLILIELGIKYRHPRQPFSVYLSLMINTSQGLFDRRVHNELLFISGLHFGVPPLFNDGHQRSLYGK